MDVDIDEAKKFNDWMQKIRNIYYSDNKKMLTAYEKINPLKVKLY